MDIVLPTVELTSTPISPDTTPRATSRSNRCGSAMTLKWLLPSHARNKQLRVKLPGAGTVRVDVGKHVEKALKSQSNEFVSKSRGNGASPVTKPKR